MLIISNPKAGDQKGSQFVEEHVIPLLTRHADGMTPIKLEETSAPGDAGIIALRYLKGVSQGEEPVIVLSGGDTTIHEAVNGLMGLKQRASVILVPSGTANALYHSLFPPKGRLSFIQGLPPVIRKEAEAIHEDVREKLYSVLAFLERGVTRRLHSTRTKILNANGEAIKEVVSCVVVSASLHASILDGAEALRSTHPGIERFKIAAAQSITQWSDARLVIQYPYQVYDHHKGDFRTLESSKVDPVELNGPFAYFLTTTNVDRLEKEFRITPLATSIPFTEDAGWMEVVMIRPHNHAPSQINGADEESRKKFAATTVKMLQGAYSDGSYLQMVQTGRGNGVVEYLRVRQWEWIPHPSDAAAHLICADGEILHIPQRGKVAVELLSSEDRPELNVYCAPL